MDGESETVPVICVIKFLAYMIELMESVLDQRVSKEMLAVVAHQLRNSGLTDYTHFMLALGQVTYENEDAHFIN